MNNYQYGVWITIYSVLEWLIFFDVGLGNGLRNKLSEALALNDKILAKELVSTAYAIISMIMGGVLVVFLAAYPFINWNSVFAAQDINSIELSLTVMIVFINFIFRFILQLIANVLYADQKPSLNGAISSVTVFLSLVSIIILKLFFPPSLFWLALFFSFSPLFVNLCFSIVLFNGKYKDIRPAIKSIKFKYSKELLSLGVQFFIIQIAYIVLFTSTNLLISHLFGPTEVTKYNVAYRYFTLVTMVYGIIIVPFWSAFTDAYVKKDFSWIKRTMKKLNYLSVLVFAGILVLLFASDFVYKIWLGGKVEVPFLLSVAMSVFTTIYVFGSPYSNFLNGVGKIRVSVIIAITGALINIPLILLLGKLFNLGAAGVVFSVCVCNSMILLFGPVQYGKIINGKAQGIWDK